MHGAEGMNAPVRLAFGFHFWLLLVCGHGQFKNPSFNFLICKMVTVKTYQIVLLQRLRNITHVSCMAKFSAWSKTFQCVAGKAVIILSTISVSQRLLTWGMWTLRGFGLEKICESPKWCATSRVFPMWVSGKQVHSFHQILEVRSARAKAENSSEKFISHISLASSATQKPLIIHPSFPLPSAEIRGEKESKILILCLKGHSEEPEGLCTSHTPWSCGCILPNSTYFAPHPQHSVTASWVPWGHNANWQQDGCGAWKARSSESPEGSLPVP